MSARSATCTCVSSDFSRKQIRSAILTAVVLAAPSFAWAQGYTQPVPAGPFVLTLDGPSQDLTDNVPAPDPIYYTGARHNYEGLPHFYGVAQVTNGATYTLTSPGQELRGVIATYAPYSESGRLIAFENSTIYVKNVSFRGGEFHTTGSGQIFIMTYFGRQPVFSSAAHPYLQSNLPRIQPESLTVFRGNVIVPRGEIILMGPAFVDGLTLGYGSTGAGLYLAKQPGAFTSFQTLLTEPQSNVVTLCGPGSVFPDIDTTYKYIPIWKPGSLKLSDNPGNFIAPVSHQPDAATVYVAPNFTISGAGNLYLPGNIAGNIVANKTNNLHIICKPGTPTTIDDTGVLTSEAGSELDLRFAPGFNSGLTNWQLDYANRTTLVGGRYVAKGYLALPDSLEVNGATLELHSTGNFIKYGQYSEDTIAELKGNYGTIQFRNGVSKVVTSDLWNTGTIELLGNGNTITYGRPVTAESYAQGIININGNNNILTFDDVVTDQVISVTGNNNQVIFKKPVSPTGIFVPVFASGASTFTMPLPGPGMKPGDAFPGGSFGVKGGATFVIPNATPFSTLGSAASITIDGSGTFSNGAQDLMQDFHFNQGALTLANGATLPSGILENQGKFIVQNDAKLNAYSQTSPNAITTVDGTFTVPNLNIAAGSLNGYFNIKGNVQIGGGALLDPGHSPTQATVDGNLSIASGSTTKMEIGFGAFEIGNPPVAVFFNDPAASDSIHVTGDLAIDPGATLQLALLPAVDPTTGEIAEVFHSLGDTITLFTIDGTLTGTFTNILQPSDVTPGLMWDIRYTPHSIVAVAIVPEPGALSLLLPAAFPLVRRRR